MPSELEGLIFPCFFAENRILGCLGGMIEASWAVLAKFLGRLGPQRRTPRCVRINQNRPQEPPRKRLEGVPEASGRSVATKKHPRAAQNPPDRSVVTKKHPRAAQNPSDLDFGASQDLDFKFFFHGFGQDFGGFNPHVLPFCNFLGG